MIIIALSVNCCGKYIPWVLIGKVSSDENGMDPTAKKPKCNQRISCTQENNNSLCYTLHWVRSIISYSFRRKYFILKLFHSFFDNYNIYTLLRWAILTNNNESEPRVLPHYALWFKLIGDLDQSFFLLNMCHKKSVTV